MLAGTMSLAVQVVFFLMVIEMGSGQDNNFGIVSRVSGGRTRTEAVGHDMREFYRWFS